MNQYKIIFTFPPSEQARSSVVVADSLGDALDIFDCWADGFDCPPKLYRVVELGEVVAV